MWMQDCGACNSAKADGLHAWMRHLTDHHVLPTEWPSTRAAKLTGPLALRPYTTITESKKKRRKDSIPRPLNSFMLFAQHVRRNVLRVFSDASNSVISQQLGDLWRTVPHEYRNQYDEEANRLVKIHQLEFPNYKYQPKKRQSVHHGGCSNNNGSGNSTSGNGKSSQHSVTNVSGADAGGLRMIDCYSKSVGRSAVGPGAGDYKHSSDRTSPHGLALFRSKVSSTGAGSSSSASHFSFSYRPGNAGDIVQKTRAKTKDSSSHIISPAKEMVKLVAHNRMETKASTIGSTTSSKSNATGLSSVLPPLLAPSRAISVTNSDLFTQNHHSQGSCDSAYASGINSSSSSSASSPAVGDLLSPIKPGCVVGPGAKSSPVSRKIQFVPIRPQSQQLYPSAAQPTRQRFLSATSGSCNIALNNGTAANQQLVLFENSACSEQLLDSIQLPDIETHHVHRLVAPVYVRLGPETNGFSEEVLLALPPGTTIIQAVDDMTHLTTPGCLGTQQQAPHRRIMRTHSLKPSSIVGVRPTHVLQPVKITHATNRHEERCTFGTNSIDYSPTPYSPGSSPSSAWSPLSGDVFLPLPHMNAIVIEPEIRCKVEDVPSFYSAYSKTEDPTFLQESSDAASDFCGMETNSQFEMDISQPITEFRQHNGLDYLENSVHSATTEVGGNPLATWSTAPTDAKSDKDQGSTRQGRLFTTIACNVPMIPLAVDITQSHPITTQTETKQPDVSVNPNADDTDFPMNTEENFDSSFDAMMSSIDITTFLPDTFAETEDSIEDFDVQNNESETGEGFGAATLRRHQLLMSDCSACLPHKRPCSEEVIPLIDIDDMLTSMDHCPQVNFRRETTTSTVTYLSEQFPSYSNYADEPGMLNEMKSADVHCRLIDNGAGNTGYNQHSPLSDLDALDKSSLFVIKPDWSLRVCE